MSEVNRDDVFIQVRDALVELVEVDVADIKPSSTLYDELDLDSIDAVDLVVQLQNLTGKKIQPEEFKSIRTVDDVVDAVVELMKAD